MGFSNLPGLLALIFVPLIIVLYMLRPKHKPRKIPSLYLWQSVMDEIESASRIHKLRNSILMILQIIAVLLLALILAGLFIKDDTVHSDVIIVVDGSLSMQSQDLSPTRHVQAKELAMDYVKQLELNTYVTVVGLSDTPDIVVNRTADKSLALSGIEGLKAGNSTWDPEVVTETLSALRQNESTVVYFGDNPIANAKTYLTLRDRGNLAVYDVVATIYGTSGTDEDVSNGGISSGGSAAVLTEVFNQGEKDQIVPVSLYLDGLFFGAKEVQVEAKGSEKLFFDGLPVTVDTIEVRLDVEDVLIQDNIARTVLKSDTVQKVLLVSDGNLFLEKVLKLEQNIELYQVSQSAEIVYEGYDLYIFDGMTPEIIPGDGALLFFDPSEDEAFQVLGHVKNPQMSTTGHVVTNTIEKPEFLSAVTQVFELPQDADSIYETDYGSAAYSWQKGHQKGIVYGFDIHRTDLPLNIEFPILMSATFRYLLTGSAVETSSLGSGESVQVYLKPNTEEAFVTMPEGQILPLDMTRANQLFAGTDQLGVYSITQVSGDEETVDRFAVNADRPSEQSGTSGTSQENERFYDTSRSLALWIGMLLIVVILVEWLIYGFRRVGRWQS